MRHRSFLGLATALLAFGAPGVAAAQTASAGFAVDRYDPSERGSDWFSTESLDLRGNGRFALGVTGDYAFRPVAAYNPDGSLNQNIIRDQLFLHAGLAVTLFDRLRLGLNVPIALYQNGQGAVLSGTAIDAPSKAALGDVRIGADLRLAGTYEDPFTLAIGVQGFLPTGDRAQYTTDGSGRVAPRILAAGNIGIFAYAARLTFLYRPLTDSFGSVDRGSEFTFGGSAGLRFFDGKLLIGPEVFGSTVTHNAFAKLDTPVEGLLGAHIRAGDFHINVGGGPGLTRGLGTPASRGLLSLEWAPGVSAAPPSDRDGDGIPDNVDACPSEPGVADPDPKKNGCPLPKDTDGDGILDPVDACVTTPGVATSDPKTNGCPRDTDGDGIPDATDACVDLPGIATTDPKTNGCPLDTDGDKIYDTQDACPTQPGVATSDPKTNGCPPDPDRDKDGIPNETDACPDEPGKADPDPKRNGCPKAFIQNGSIRILDQVKFKTASAQILPGKDSLEVLEAVQKVLDTHPEVTKVEIQGHTDNRGAAAYNRKLSAARAASVVSWLTSHGVAASRLTSNGFGPDKPIDTNENDDGRRNNRRVEFKILEPSTDTPPPAAPAP